MTYAYRFVIDGTGIDFVAPGELQNADGVWMVVAEVGYDQALALQQHAKAATPIMLFVQVADRDVAFMPVHKVKASAGRGSFVQVACIVRMPDPWSGAGRA
jgi:hypothetical protein